MKKYCRYDAIHLKCRRNYAKSNSKRGIFELCLPLTFSFWCLVLLFYSKFGLTCANEGNVQADNGTTANNVSVCNGNNCNDAAYSCVNDSKVRTIDDLLFEFNLSVIVNDSDIHDYRYDNPKYSYRKTSVFEDLLWSFLGNTSLICVIQPQIQQEQKPTELVQNGKNRSTYLNLDEFRNITKLVKGGSQPSRLMNISQRLEPDGTKYNYASAAKGAKVVACNKEAKGASNVLGKDHDKYLRNPCSIKEKFVIIELTEETLVDAVKIANFEHYSSNFKEFELFGSLVYPTDNWVPLGKFVAANVKHAQCFKLAQPKWIRYFKLNLFTHYGSEFYCTLSVVEVYGIDAIKRMLEDLIVDPKETGAKELSDSNSTSMPLLGPQAGPNDPKIDDDFEQEIKIKVKDGTGDGPRAVVEVKPQKSMRIHSDAVLKILMLKVRSLEINLLLLEEYIKELNKRQGDLLPDIDKELTKYLELLEKIRTEIKDLLEWKEVMEKGVNDLKSWKAVVSSRINALVQENDMLRSDVEKVVIDQTSLGKKEIAVLLASFCFAFFAILKLASEVTFPGASVSGKVYRASKGWILMLVSCGITILLILLCG